MKSASFATKTAPFASLGQKAHPPPSLAMTSAANSLPARRAVSHRFESLVSSMVFSFSQTARPRDTRSIAVSNVQLDSVVPRQTTPILASQACPFIRHLQTLTPLFRITGRR
ncbi:MAG: hypothetical protein IBX71_10440 [Candidatus Desulforudis sp.]|nr:hypothetical protein [Desulforudis sp.]